MWELDHKEGWELKNWCFWAVFLEKTLKSPLDFKEIKPVNPNGNQSWIFFGSTDAEAPALWPPNVGQLISKDRDSGKDWRQEEKGKTEKMVGWHHWLNGVWASSRRCWWTGKPATLQSIGLQRVRHDWASWLNNYHLCIHSHIYVHTNTYPPIPNQIS